MSLIASEFNTTDSTQIDNVVNEFFSWYLTAIRQSEYLEFKPQFIENGNGMTTLDCTRYLTNLRKYHFSDSLIELEKQSYQVCISHLEKVKYADFKSTFTDLDDFEETNCDFGNYYRWTGGQELIDGIRIRKMQLIKNITVLVSLEYYEYDSSTNKYYYWGHNKLTLSYNSGKWKITNINWK